MPAPKLSPEAWKQVRIASEAGCTDEELMRVYGVTKNAIKQRRFRESWNTPQRLEQEKAMQAVKAQSRSINGATVMDVTDGSKTANFVLSERGEKGSVIASGLLLNLLQRAEKQPDALRSLASAQDVSVALTAIRKAAGMDREQTANVSVSLALFADGGKPWRDVSPDAP